MSGGLFEFSAAGTLVVKASFWSGSSRIVTFGFALWKAAAAWLQTVLRSPAVALFHHVRVTCLLPAELGLLLLPPHAARVSAVVAARVMAAYFRMLRMVIS